MNCRCPIFLLVALSFFLPLQALELETAPEEIDFPGESQCYAIFEVKSRSESLYLKLQHNALADLSGIDLTLLDPGGDKLSFQVLFADSSSLHILVDGRSGIGDYSLFFADYNHAMQADPVPALHIFKGKRKWQPDKAYGQLIVDALENEDKEKLPASIINSKTYSRGGHYVQLLKKKIDILCAHQMSELAEVMIYELDPKVFRDDVWAFYDLVRKIDALEYMKHWPMQSRRPVRDGRFYCSGHDLNLKLSAIKETYISDPRENAYSSGRAIRGRYSFGFDDAALHDLLGANISSGVVERSNVCYLGTDDGNVHAVSLRQKSLLWSHKLDGTVVSDPLFFSGFVYFVTQEGSIYAYDLHKGKLLWKLKLKGKCRASLAASKNILCIGDDTGHVYGIHWQDGRHVWVNRLPAAINGTACIYDKRVYVATVSGDIYALRLADGHIEHQNKLSGAVNGGLAYYYCSATDLVVAGTEKGLIHFMNRDLKELLHSPLDLEGPVLTPIVNAGLVFVTTEQKFFQIDPYYGRVLFEFTPPQGIFNRAPVFDGKSIWVNTIPEDINSLASCSSYRFSFGESWPRDNVNVFASKHPIVIDGKMDEKAWENVKPLEASYLYNGIKHDLDFKLYLRWDKDYCYLFGLMEDSSPKSFGAKDGDPIWRGDCFEFYISPNRKDESLYQLNINAKGLYLDDYVRYNNRITAKKEWNSDLEYEVFNVPGKESGWGFEARFPWKSFARHDFDNLMKERKGLLNFSYLKRLYKNDGHVFVRHTAVPSYRAGVPHKTQSFLPFTLKQKKD
ncbi:MAG: PQQ-binding-like beta-propeller repeat protein [Planctomycetes bacterium]|nr:PQQ-binding-like beta-propeller repeat protein [Planctomycetota bacterium]